MANRQDTLSAGTVSDLLASIQELIDNADNKARHLLTASGFIAAALSLSSFEV